jgi:hypothetical protein
MIRGVGLYATFDHLVGEAALVPTEGWDFSWFDGRATEERPSWGYAKLLADRMTRASAVLDVQTGGSEVLARALEQTQRSPVRIAATESWPPNLEIARRALNRFGASLFEANDDADLPFDPHSFDLVVSRHPVITIWPELRPTASM